MGWFKKVANNNILSANDVGGLLNDITGKSASARQQFKNQMALQKDAQAFSKWQMENAHQTEVEDLKKAGLNPALSAGGGGASAGVSIGSAGDGGASINPMALIQGMVDSVNSAKATNAQVQQANANTAKTQAETWNIVKRTEPEINKIMTETNELKQKIKESEQKVKESESTEDKNKAEEELIKAETEYKDWLNEHPIIRTISEMGGAIGAIGSFAGAMMGTRTAKKLSARKKTTTTRHYNKRGEITGLTEKETY